MHLFLQSGTFIHQWLLRKEHSQDICQSPNSSIEDKCFPWTRSASTELHKLMKMLCKLLWDFHPQRFVSFIKSHKNTNSQRAVAMCMELLSISVSMYMCVCVCTHSGQLWGRDKASQCIMTHGSEPPRLTHTCVSQAILGWIVLKTRDWKVPLGQRADWVIIRNQAGEVVGLKKWCCETVRQLSAGRVKNSVKGFLSWL